MGKLIDADELYAAFRRDIMGGLNYDRILREAKPVDAVPVMHGRWKEDPSGYGFWICSACGFVSEASAANLLYKYCPNCGARMDGKGNGNETD